MVGRVSLALMVMSSLSLPWVLEQPGSSLLELHPAFQRLSKHFQIFKVFTWVGAYGGHSPKPTILYSNKRALIQGLYMPLPRNAAWDADMVTKYVDTSGVARVQGTRKSLKLSNKRVGSKDLKGSQYYPPLFGRAVAEAVLQNQEWKFERVAPRVVAGTTAE